MIKKIISIIFVGFLTTNLFANFSDEMKNMTNQMIDAMSGKGIVKITPDYARELRLVTQIEDSVMEGEIEKLSLLNGDRFFSIYTESEKDDIKGGVIIMHNRGQHANWENVIKPLRIDLAQKGWNTLSIQMPVLDKQATYYDYLPIFPYANERIIVAINYLKSQGIKKIILIGHGCGVHMSMNYIDMFSDRGLSGYVGIGMGATDYKQQMPKPFPLLKMQMPVLDIYGEKDYPGVLRLAKERKKDFAMISNKKTKQMVVKGADHYYKKPKTEKELLKKINSWLNTL